MRIQTLLWLWRRRVRPSASFVPSASASVATMPGGLFLGGLRGRPWRPCRLRALAESTSAACSLEVCAFTDRSCTHESSCDRAMVELQRALEENALCRSPLARDDLQKEEVGGGGIGGSAMHCYLIMYCGTFAGWGMMRKVFECERRSPASCVPAHGCRA